MRTALLILLAFAAPAFASTVWKWVDEQGVTHYSDRPVPGATKVEVRVGSSWDSTVPRSSTATAPPSGSPAAADTKYRNFEIWRPENEQMFVNVGGQVSVEIRIDPALQPAHTLNLYLDGKLVEGFPDNTTSYALTDLPRGAHQVIATVNELRGRRIQETAPVTFTIRQESAAQPPVGPALRPPPKPRSSGAANKLPARQPTYGTLNGSPPAMNPATNMPVVTKPAPKPSKP